MAAMQLAGPGVYGPPRDPEAAVEVLRSAIEAGVNHIDTSDFYGPYVTNEIIRKALHPYPEGLVIVTKVGCFRGEDKSWNPALSAADLKKAVRENLEHLGLEALDVVNLRVGGLGGAGGGIDCGAVWCCWRITEGGADSAPGAEQCDFGSVGGGAGDRGGGVHPEFVQLGASGG